jgi:hypothetical protein
MVGWCEEVNKALEGLRRTHNIGRLLNGCHGLSWGSIRGYTNPRWYIII